MLEEGKRKQGLVGALNILKASGLPILPFCEQAAEWLALERVRLKRLGLTPPKYDSEIAAVAVVNNLILVTRNVDDFYFYAGLQVENWFD
ncbi:hypothetical protein [Thiothrix subterranea]|uniref:hypothetical protein n=1 Tax=Thiothrix subterranea TaxID=2735563 RepID=UPI00280BFBB0|nr:hypothetical protein [Thiothrix subterranea]